MNRLNSVFLIISFLLALSALLPQKIFSSIPKKSGCEQDKSRLTLILLVAALLLGVGIRLYRFGAVPVGINQDGAMAAVDGKALADYGTDRFGTWRPAHLNAWGFGQMSSLLSYLIAFWVKLFGLNTITMRLPQLLASLMGGVFFCLLARDISGRRAMLIAAFFASIDPWHFMQSRWALDCNLLPHFLICAVWLLLKGSDGKKVFLYLSMVVFGLCMYCYGIALYSIPLFLIFSCAWLVANKNITIRNIYICVGLYILVSWPFLLTMAINVFGWENISLPFVTCQFFPDSMRSADIIFFSPDIKTQLAENLESLYDTVILQKDRQPWNYMADFGCLYLFSLPFALVGLVRVIREVQCGNTSCFLVLLMLLNGLWIGLCTKHVNINQINSIFYAIMLLCVLGLAELSERFSYGAAVMGLIYALSAALMVNTYFGSYSDYLSRYAYAGFGQALECAEGSGADVICVTVNTQGKKTDYVSEIITLFYDRTDAEYFQGKTNINKGEKLLPYKERFLYITINEAAAEQYKQNTAFVVKCGEEVYFPAESYEAVFFDDYCCVLPK